MTNLNNFGVVSGRLTRDPQIKTNRDGSRWVGITIAAANNFKTKDGKRSAQFVNLQAFVPADKHSSIWETERSDGSKMIAKGKTLTLSYTVRSNAWTDQNGNTQYNQVLQVDPTSIVLGPDAHRSQSTVSEEQMAEIQTRLEALEAVNPADVVNNEAEDYVNEALEEPQFEG